jgi:hypothetical protein
MPARGAAGLFPREPKARVSSERGADRFPTFSGHTKAATSTGEEEPKA